MSKRLRILLAIAIGIGVAISGFGTIRVSHPLVSRTVPISISTTTSESKARANSTSSVSRMQTGGAESLSQLAQFSNVEWKRILTPPQYAVLRENGTEIPFTSTLLHESRAGTFVTADCGEPVFRSEKKFDSGTGWPSFYAPIASSSVVIQKDTSFGIVREEVETPICHSHVGHLFHDAPQMPTGDRFCINGVALRFIPDAGQ